MTRCAAFFVVAAALFLFHAAERGVRKPESLAALDFWTNARAFPAADIPDGEYFKAYETAKRHPALNTGNDEWQSIGPTNFSGRVISVAINPLNPNTIYVGAASGGLWRSRTGGLGGDWQRVITGFPVLGVNAIAIDPSDTSTMYIGTGEVYRYQVSTGGIVIRTTRGSYGMGILKTTNAGATWTRSLDWSYHQQRGVQAIRINPLHTRTIVAATSEGVYRTRDGGATWTNVLNVIGAHDLVVHPTDTTKILVACGNFSSLGFGVYRSTDAGNSFSRVSTLPNFSGKGMLELFAANPDIVFASLGDSTTSTGRLARTTDFGATWSIVSTEALYGVQGWYSHFVAVHPTDVNQVVRGGVNIYKSTNGGASSSQRSGAYFDMHNYAHHPTNPNILYVVSDGGVYRSTNFGDSYQDVNAGLLTSQFYNGFSTSASDSNMALGQTQDRFGWKYVGSTIWPMGGVDEIGWTAINQANDQFQYAGNRNGGAIYKSIDRGNAFTSSSSGISGGVPAWNTPFALSRSNPNVLYFARSIVFKSTNAAASWTATNGGAALDGNPALAIAIAPTNPDTAFVATIPTSGLGRTRLHRTTNGGISWSDVTGTLPNRYLLDIAVDPVDSRIVYVAIGGFDTMRVAKSTNAGTAWLDASGSLPNVPTTAVAFDPFNSRIVYVGNDIGVFVSSNGGATWSSFNDGLPDAVLVADLVVSPSSRKLRLASHGNGVFERKLASTTTGVASSRQAPLHPLLVENYPNPFNPMTTIRFAVAASSHVIVTVHDVAGRVVSELLNERVAPGAYTIPWGPTAVASGVYYCRVQAGNSTVSRKMLLVR